MVTKTSAQIRIANVAKVISQHAAQTKRIDSILARRCLESFNDDPTSAAYWLISPHPELQNRSPSEAWAQHDFGRVNRLLEGVTPPTKNALREYDRFCPAFAAEVANQSRV